MLKNYFAIIQKAIAENRKKGQGVYYERHHIIPTSFGKKSTTVLLTAEEHYKAHRYLAESFKLHPIYGQKMLWAFHRMTYNNGRKISEQEYVEARELLMVLWKRNKTDSFKNAMSIKMQGNKNGVGGKKNWKPTEETRKKYSELAIKRQTGKIGQFANASKGSVIYESESGQIIEAGSALQLSKILNVNSSTIQFRLKDKHGIMLKGYSVRYKELY
jgi:hypothetical protein